MKKYIIMSYIQLLRYYANDLKREVEEQHVSLNIDESHKSQI